MSRGQQKRVAGEVLPFLCRQALPIWLMHQVHSRINSTNKARTIAAFTSKDVQYIEVLHILLRKHYHKGAQSKEH